MPGPLLRLIGYDALMSRLPPAYSRALFAAQLATQYYYEKAGGLAYASSSLSSSSSSSPYHHGYAGHEQEDDPSAEFTFYEFISRYDL